MPKMLNNKRKAQSAMEYLMTYGWAILIIAVVLAALFSLGVFNGGALLGTSCVAAPGYLCQSPVLFTSGNVLFTFGQNTGSQIYNVGFACTATSTSSGPNPTNSVFYIYEPSGSVGSGGQVGNWAIGIANVPGYVGTSYTFGTSNSLSTYNALTLQSGVQLGQMTQYNSIPCYGPTGNPDNALSVGAAFSGSIWMNYTQNAGAPGGSNPFLIAKVATITVRAS